MSKTNGKVRINKKWTGDVLTLTFMGYDADGKKVPLPGFDPITFDRTAASESNRDHAERHGWEQKLGDVAAMSRDNKTGESASPVEKHAAVMAEAVRLANAAEPWNRQGREPIDEDALLAQLLEKRGMVAIPKD